LREKGKTKEKSKKMERSDENAKLSTRVALQ